MPRQAPLVRDSVPDDALDLIHLWSTVSGTGPHPDLERSHGDAQRALATIAADPDQRLLVIETDGVVVAAMKVSRGPLWPLALEQAVHSSFLLVLPQFRRHGYGHALMDAALVWAEEKDISQVTVVTDGNRDTNRFFARLGLSTLGNVRHSTTASLRKRLTADRGRVGGNRHLVDVLAQRRSARRRQAAG